MFIVGLGKTTNVDRKTGVLLNILKRATFLRRREEESSARC